jgi:alpha-L-rhamnosidase
MRFGERLNPDGTVFRDNLTTALAMDTYICKGGGLETWQPRFTYHGFQYLEVQGLAQPPTTKTLTAISLRAHLTDAGSFQCSNGQINQIYSNSQNPNRRSFAKSLNAPPQIRAPTLRF